MHKDLEHYQQKLGAITYHPRRFLPTIVGGSEGGYCKGRFQSPVSLIHGIFPLISLRALNYKVPKYRDSQYES